MTLSYISHTCIVFKSQLLSLNIKTPFFIIKKQLLDAQQCVSTENHCRFIRVFYNKCQFPSFNRIIIKFHCIDDTHMVNHRDAQQFVLRAIGALN